MMLTYIHYEELKAFLTVQETARLLNVSVPTIYRMIKTGELPAKRVRYRFIIKAEDLERFMNQ